MCDFETKSRERGRNVTDLVYNHFYSLTVEAGFYGNTGRVIDFFYEVKQRRARLVPGWVTVVLDFVEDPVSDYTPYQKLTKSDAQISDRLMVENKHFV